MNKTTHYMISVQDSINGYREVQTGYVDTETREEAIKYFITSKPWVKYFGNGRYQITMTTNPDILQWPDEDE